jgi:sugar-specific transcriptional regulator TrmB
MMSSFETTLQKMGLSVKEARVYLASLALGASPVQKISGAAKVNRATTYVMIESLTERGLMGSFEKGKKTLFVAQPPEHLQHLLDQEDENVKKKKALLMEIMPELRSIISYAGEKPRVTLYEGKNGLREIHEDLISFGKKAGSIDNIAAVDDARELVIFEEMENHWDRIAKNKIKVRAIFTQSGHIEKIPDSLKPYWQERRIEKSKFPFHGEVVIYGDKVAALSFKGEILGFILESREIAQTMRTLFELAWIGARENEVN